MLAVPNVALDFAYISKSPFYSKSFFATLIVVLLLRIVIIVAGFQGYLFHQLTYKPGMSTTDIHVEGLDEDDSIE